MLFCVFNAILIVRLHGTEGRGAIYCKMVAYVCIYGTEVKIDGFEHSLAGLIISFQHFYVECQLKIGYEPNSNLDA